MTFLPNDYEKPKTPSRYLKLEKGENTFRILGDAITGFIDWKDQKPFRTKERPEDSFDPKKPAKHFWAFPVWDYNDSLIKILEVTQATIQDAIITLNSSKDWGNPTGYDLLVTRSGESLETKYSVVPKPPKELSEEIKKEFDNTPISIDRLFDGEDPFDVSEKEPEIKVENVPQEEDKVPDFLKHDNATKKDEPAPEVPLDL